MNTPHHHNSGWKHQSNKQNKTGRHATKGTLKRKAGGKQADRVGIKTGDITKTREGSKRERRNTARQLSLQKREALVEQARRGTTVGLALHPLTAAPLLTAVIPLTPAASPDSLVAQILEQADHKTSSPGPITAGFGKSRITFFIPPRHVHHLLDLVKVADVVLFVVHAADTLGDAALKIINLIKAQGLPSVLIALQGLGDVPLKKKNEVRKRHSKFLHFHFPQEPRVLPADTEAEVAQVIRFLGELRPALLSFREHRAYLLADQWEFGPDGLRIFGYLRGVALSADQLVHIAGVGDFQLNEITAVPDPHTTQLFSGPAVLATPSPNQEPLVVLNEPGPWANEQTWPNPDDFFNKEKTGTVLVPKGTSAYQAQWFIDDGDDEEEGDGKGRLSAGEPSDEELLPDAMQDEGEGGGEGEEGEPGEEEEEEEEEQEWIELGGPDKDESSGSDMDFEDLPPAREQAAPLDLAAEEAEYIQFPDETDTPEDVPARQRFMKYRGLKSFRSTPWNPKENLPYEYAHIFQFSNFARTSRLALERRRDAVGLGAYLCLTVRNVPAEAMQQFADRSVPLVVGALLRHEAKVSVLHFRIKRNPGGDSRPVRSRERLVFSCGWRRFEAEPLFSEDNPTGTKHRAERFLLPGRTAVASIFGPITFGHAPVLVFRSFENDPDQLLATGNLLNVDPDRIILKRIILSGHPAKIHKKFAIIKMMFFHPEGAPLLTLDIRWFKNTELWTKWGRRGLIRESVGTHGAFKAYFDGHIKSQDTVCMSLYKRAYPGWGVLPPLATHNPDQ